MNTSTMVHKGFEREYKFKAERNIREDGTIYFTLKIFDDDSDVYIFFDRLSEVKTLIKELKKL